MTMRTGRVVMTAVLAFAAGGCLEHTYTVGTGAPVGPKVYEEWHSHWLGGLIGERTMDIDEYCPSGNATIENEQSFLNGLVAALTSGIYMPTTVTIRCDDGRNADVELDEGEVMTILHAPEFLGRVEEMAPSRFADAQVSLRALQQDDQD